jgi:hypothetical protein
LSLTLKNKNMIRNYPSEQNISQLVATPTPIPGTPTPTPTLTPTPTPTPSFNPPITTSNLWLYADGTYGRCYTGGTSWIDISPNGFAGTLSSPSTNWSYKEQYNGYFDITGITFSFANASSGTTTGDWSYGCWIAANPLGTARYIYNGSLINNGVYNLVVGSSSGNFWQVQTNTTVSGQISCVSNIPIVDNSTWVYVMGVWKSGTSLKIYINGVLNNTTNSTDTTLQTPTQGWNGGQWDNVPKLEYPYKLGDIQVYNKALSDAEVLNNYNAKKTIYL